MPIFSVEYKVFVQQMEAQFPWELPTSWAPLSPITCLVVHTCSRVEMREFSERRILRHEYVVRSRLSSESLSTTSVYQSLRRWWIRPPQGRPELPILIHRGDRNNNNILIRIVLRMLLL